MEQLGKAAALTHDFLMRFDDLKQHAARYQHCFPGKPYDSSTTEAPMQKLEKKRARQCQYSPRSIEIRAAFPPRRLYEVHDSLEERQGQRGKHVGKLLL